MKEIKMKSYQSCAVCIWIAFIIFMAGLGLARQACDKGEIYEVSGYCAQACCCGSWADGRTASNAPAVGRICAADPSIPFGTRLHIEGYGWVTVEDRGGAIKGQKLDLLFPTHAEALAWGRRKVEVRHDYPQK
jgi:3D (Asp-Asp-Asp) domain-containing protein